MTNNPPPPSWGKGRPHDDDKPNAPIQNHYLEFIIIILILFYIRKYYNKFFLKY